MDFGISYFIVKFDKSKKEELLGISRTHMSKFDLAPPHELIKTWHWTSLQSWNVNWEVGICSLFLFYTGPPTPGHCEHFYLGFFALCVLFFCADSYHTGQVP